MQEIAACGGEDTPNMACQRDSVYTPTLQKLEILPSLEKKEIFRKISEYLNYESSLF